MKSSTLLTMLLVLCSFASQAQISGSVYKDFNANGTKDANEPFAGGVIVNFYSASEAFLGSVTTTSPLTGTSNYTFTPAAYPVRVEFVIPASTGLCISSTYDFGGYAAGTVGSNVRFVTAAATVNFSINNPAEYVKNPNPYIFVVRQVAGDPIAGTAGTATDSSALEAIPYNSALSAPGTTAPAQRRLANKYIGTSNGVAYSKQSGRVFTSAYIKRHSGLGTLGSGGIYMVDSSLSTTSVASLYDFDANGIPTRSTGLTYGSGVSYSTPNDTVVTFPGATDAVSGYPIGMGIIGSNAARGLTNTSNTKNNDPAAFAQVGIYGLGDLDISDDGTALYSVNLYDRKIYKLSLNNTTNPTAVSAAAGFALPAPPLRNTLGGGFAVTYAGDNANFYNGVKGRLRPFALKFYRGKLYVGAVTTGEGTGAVSTKDDNTGNPEYTDLWAYVFVFDPATNTWASAPALQFPLNFARGVDSDNFDETFHPWKNTMTNGYTWSVATTIRLFYAQPMFTDIAFDPQDGSMILGFKDRVGDQVGHFNNKLSGANEEVATAMGDIFRAYRTSSCTFELESAGREGPSSAKAASGGATNGQGPGGGEFYFQDNVSNAGTFVADWHMNTTAGSLITLPGTGEVATSSMDPANAWQHGIDWFSNTLGTNTRNHVMEQSSGSAAGGAGKGNGLGDIELTAYDEPIVIGNRLWNDLNGDGVQNANEAGIGGVTLELYADFNNDGIPDGAVLGTVLTAANGTWYFNDANVADGDPVTVGAQIGIKPNATYLIRVAASDWNPATKSGTGALLGYQLTKYRKQGAGQPDFSDNDAALITSGATAFPQISFTSGAPGSTNTNLDLGFKGLGSIGDRVWLDNGAGAGTAGNGVQDGTEPGVAGVTVTLYNASGVPVATTVTDAYGNYLFDNIAAGNYTVGFTLPANYHFSPQTNTADDNNVSGASTTGSDADPVTGRTYVITISAGERNTNIDAGLTFNAPAVTQSLGNTVWLDNGLGGGTAANGIQDGTEPGVSGVTVTLYNAAGTVILGSTTTDASGKYLFNNIPAGTYVVGFSLPAGMRFSPKGALATDLNSDVNLTGASAGKTDAVTVAAGNNIVYVDAGIYPTTSTVASLGDRVWNDLNHDGVQNTGEPGISGVTVNLYASNGTTLIATTVTDANGYYMFTNLAPAIYIVEFVKPAAYTFSPVTVAGANIYVNSDANISTGRTAPVNLVAGDRNASIDAGMYVTAPAGTLSLGDKVFNDLNRDGIQSANEPGVPGITAALYRNGTDGIAGTADDVLVGTTFTDASGNYYFTDLAASTGTSTYYNVQFSNLPVGYSFTITGAGTAATDNNANGTGRTAAINLTATDLTIDAGIYQGADVGKASLGDRVFSDLNGNGIQDAGEPGIGGATVTLQKDVNGDGVISGAGETAFASTTTNALGNYLFTNLDAGLYAVQFSNLPVGSVISPRDAGTNDDADSDGSNAGTTIAAGTTSLTGNYTLAAGQDNYSVDLGIVPPASTNTLGDFVWFDKNADGIQTAGEPGVAGVSVTLYNSTGTAIAYTATDKNGFYLFSGLADGTYSVGFANLPAGFDFTSKSATNDATGSDADAISGLTASVTLSYAAGGINRNNTTIDAGLISNAGGIGNYVWLDANGDGVQDASEKGIAGVTVTLYASDGTTVLASTVTDATGNYYFPNLAAGSYVIGFSTIPDGLEFTAQVSSADNGNDTNSDATPATGKTFVITLSAGETDLTIDAGLRPTATATVGDYVWSDLNGDGLQGANEPGIGGIVVTLYNSSNVAIGSAITDASGKYLITNVAPGTGYYVIFSNTPSNPVGSSQQPSFTTQGGNAGTNTSHADAAGKSNTFTVLKGDNITNIDAGIKNYPIASVVAVKELDIDAVLHGAVATINWTTKNEVNTAKFIVERSTDNRTFTEAGERAGAGSYAGTINYTLDDNVSNISAAVIYYRIKELDLDGRVSYSNVVAVRLTGVKDVHVWPTPFTDRINIALLSDANQTVNAQLIDAGGRVVRAASYKLVKGSNQIDMSSLQALARENYVLKITAESGALLSTQVITKN